MNWEDNFVTPMDAIILKPKTSHPQKKRRLKVDKEISIDSNEIKNNIANPETLIRIPVCILFIFKRIINCGGVFFQH